MTKVTVEEPKSIVEEVTKYECEQCGARVNEDDINTAGVIDGVPSSTARFSDHSVDTGHYCEDCTGTQQALKIREQKEYLRARWEGFRGTVDTVLPTVTGMLGLCSGVGIMWLVLIAEKGNEYSFIEDILLSAFTFWISVVLGSVLVFILYDMIH